MTTAKPASNHYGLWAIWLPNFTMHFVQ